jgi:hypothetical protein
MQQTEDLTEVVHVTYRTEKSVHLALKQAALDERSSVKQILDRLVKQYLKKHNQNTKNNATSNTSI